MAAVHLVHGFNVSDGGENTTDRLKPYFEEMGFSTVQHDYGWLGFLGVRLSNRRIAKRIVDKVQPGDIGCGHSNGCALLAQAAEMGAPFKGLIFINPALDQDTDIAGQVKWIHVYHNAGDTAVKVARWMPFHQWGDMGAVGYTGMDGRFRNIDCGGGPVPVSGHSDIFTKLEPWGYVIALQARGA